MYNFLIIYFHKLRFGRFGIYLLLSILLSACSSKPLVIEPVQKYSGQGNHQIYVVSHGWHTGLVLPAKEVFEVIPELAKRFAGVPKIEFGWGDTGFYQAEEMTTGITIKAMFAPSDAVIHAVAVKKEVSKYFPKSEVDSIFLNDSELSSLIQFINKSFSRDKQNSLIPTKLGIYGDSQFYSAEGDYYLLNTCNRWTAKALKSIGMNVTPLFMLTSDSVMNFIKQHKQNAAFNSQ